jgi:hypothetical protein
MPLTTASTISDAPPIDELVALSEVQHADEFRSTTTSRSCCLCKRSSRQTTLVCVNASRQNERLPLPLHIAAEITDTYSPSLYISLLLAQIDNINKSFLCALWLCSSHEQHNVMPRYKSSSLRWRRSRQRWNTGINIYHLSYSTGGRWVSPSTSFGRSSLPYGLGLI